MRINFVFLNGGNAVARFEDNTYTYTHCYDDMQQLAEDYIKILVDGIDGSELMHWDNNEPEMWDDNFTGCAFYEEDTETESPYNVLTELDSAWGGNVAEFLDCVKAVLQTV